MSPVVQVILFPPDKTPTSNFMLAIQPEFGDSFGGWAKSDGLPTNEYSADFEGAVVFSTADEAIQWAKARRWRVINEMMFGKHAQVPSRMTVLVISAVYAPWYVLHNTLEQRAEAGEQVRQVEIKFRSLDVLTEMGGSYVVIDSAALNILRAAGIRSPQEMEERIFVLESEDPNDLFRPLRIVQVIEN